MLLGQRAVRCAGPGGLLRRKRLPGCAGATAAGQRGVHGIGELGYLARRRHGGGYRGAGCAHTAAPRQPRGCDQPAEGVQAFTRVLASDWPRVLVTPRTAAVESAASADPQPAPAAVLGGRHERPAIDRGTWNRATARAANRRDLAGTARPRPRGHPRQFPRPGRALAARDSAARTPAARTRGGLGAGYGIQSADRCRAGGARGQARPQPQADVASTHAKRIRAMSASEREALLAKARQAKVGAQ